MLQFSDHPIHVILEKLALALNEVFSVAKRKQRALAAEEELGFHKSYASSQC